GAPAPGHRAGRWGTDYRPSVAAGTAPPSALRSSARARRKAPTLPCEAPRNWVRSPCAGLVAPSRTRDWGRRQRSGRSWPTGPLACPGARPGIRGGNGPGAARLYPGQAPRQARTPRPKQPTCRQRRRNCLTVESGFIRSHMGTAVPRSRPREPEFPLEPAHAKLRPGNSSRPRENPWTQARCTGWEPEFPETRCGTAPDLRGFQGTSVASLERAMEPILQEGWLARRGPAEQAQERRRVVVTGLGVVAPSGV